MTSSDKKNLYAYINTENEVKANIIGLAAAYESNGADGLYIYNHTADEKEKDDFFRIIKEVTGEVDIPILVGCRISCFDDAKHAYYTGASGVVFQEASVYDEKVIKLSSDRFGISNVYLEIDMSKEAAFQRLDELSGLCAGGLMLKHVEVTAALAEKMSMAEKKVFIRDSLIRNSLESLLRLDNIFGIATNYYADKDIIKAKKAMVLEGISLDLFESSIQFDDFKLNSDGLIPVIAQDYLTGEVLMLAYMNRESFDATVRTGKMTYYSRSRKQLWQKGETSGHFQYVKELRIDCDNDTILAKVKQTGAACHTGNYSCFYTELLKRLGNKEKPQKILDEVYSTIVDRKKNPKEGSYTNYLFNKGLDKILKKCGEEATEIVIAAKNHEGEELKYEIADFLYHLMVLMAEKEINWEDITTELANRH